MLSNVDTTPVDILQPPYFEPNGEVKPINQAIADGNWLGSFHIWLYKNSEEPTLLLQRRSHDKLLDPGKFETSAAGHYDAGEKGVDGLRELKEELGIELPPTMASFLFKRFNIVADTEGVERRAVVSVYFAEWNGNLSELTLEREEVDSVYEVPLLGLVQLFDEEIDEIKAVGIDANSISISHNLKREDFPYQVDDYFERAVKEICVFLEKI